MNGEKISKKISLLVLVVTATSGCNQAKFGTIDPDIRGKLISQEHIFDPSGQDTGYGQLDSNGQDSGYGQTSPNGQDSGYGQTNPTNAGGPDSGYQLIAPTTPSGTDSGATREPSSIGTPVVVQPTTPPNPVFGSNSPSSTDSTTSPTTSPSDSSVVPPVGPAVPPLTPEQLATLPPMLPSDLIDHDAAPIPPSPTQIPLRFECSNGLTRAKGANLVMATTFKAEIVQYKDGKEVSRCTEDAADLADKIKSSKVLTFTKCAPKGTLINSGRATNENFRTAPGEAFSLNLISNGVSILTQMGRNTPDKVNILFDANSKAGNPPYPLLAANQALCDEHHSPLFVDLRSEYEKTKKFSLRAPWEGVWFDILGQNADGVAHTPSQISWFTSSTMAYITLPDSQGRVLGIDQLFGDNTMGPDGNFASNGYEALAKYDSNKDGVITSEDVVFKKLRIWQDKNHDGIAQISELRSMRDSNLVAIDLHYDANFAEHDIYGNSIKYKSVAKTADGEYKLVFDIWFELNQIKAQQRVSMLTQH
jgi:hypothetical protein